MSKQREDRYSDVAAFVAVLQTAPEPTVIEKSLDLGKSQKDWLKEGDLFYNHKQYQEAIKAYEEAIRLDPNNAMAYINKGNALSNLRRYEEAIKTYEGAIRLDPHSAWARNGKKDAAFKKLKEATRRWWPLG
jgi:tetratricopeptide (TPR) repeat protein